VAACYSKNGESRTLPMGERLKAVLREAMDSRGTVPRVFLSQKGQPWGSRNFSHAFQKACIEAGLKDCSPHTLRHTFASRLVMAGVDLRTVQELLGHKDIKMTLRYAHLSPSHKRQAMVALERQFSGKSPAHFHDTPVSSPSDDYAKAVNI
jgi:site-specific recombinase XerD